MSPPHKEEIYFDLKKERVSLKVLQKKPNQEVPLEKRGGVWEKKKIVWRRSHKHDTSSRVFNLKGGKGGKGDFRKEKIKSTGLVFT